MTDSASFASGETTLVDGDGPGDAPRVERGTAVDRYVILERIGSGAMGVVYAAFDPRLDRQVAVKLLTRRADHDILLDEARALARLSHPNVVAVHDAGLFHETVFITMERVEGQTLDAWLAEEPQRTWRSVLGVLLGAGRGLAAAHRADAVHRDFKPKNVMVARNGIAKVMDFGLAAFANTEEDTDAPRRRPKGTPMYMAPEQHLGQPATFASDQYAFCVVAYEALARRHPRADARTPGALLEALGRDPPTLSCPGLPTRVRAAILRGLSPEVDDRWPSMQALLDVFASALRGSRSRWLGAATLAGLGSVAWVVSASREAPSCGDVQALAASLIPEAQRADVEAALASFDETYGTKRAALISSGIDTYARRWAESDAQACRGRAERPRERTQHAAIRACLQRHRDDFAGAIGVLGDAVGVERARAADLLDELSDPQSCLAGDQASRSGVRPPPLEDADAVAALRARLAALRAQTAVGRWVEVVERAEPVVHDARELGYAPLLAEALAVRGAAQLQLRATDDAEKSLSDAAWIALEEGDRRLALRVAVQLVALRREISRSHVNVAWAQRARRMIRGGSEPSVEAELELHLSSARREVGDFEQAKHHAEAAREVIARVHGEDHPQFAEATHAYAAAVFRLGDYGHALEVARENIERREAVLGRRHPSLVGSLQLFAAVAMAADEFREAEDAANRAIELQRSVVGPRTGIEAGLLNNLGSLYRSQKRYREAHVALDEAISIWESLEMVDMVVYAYSTKGSLVVESGDDEAAGPWFDRAWAAMDARGGPHPLRGIVAAVAGASAVRLAEFAAARTWLERADDHGSLRNNELRAHQGWWALLLDAEGDSEEARRKATLAVDGERPFAEPHAQWWAKVQALAEE